MLRMMLAAFAALAATACTTTREVPGAPVEVLVPVPVPCEPVQVPAPNRPTVRPGAGLNELARTALADRRVLEGYAARLAAANQNPCPEVKK